MKDWLMSLFYGIIVFVFIVASVVLVLSKYSESNWDYFNETFEKCCGGNICTDTWWNGTDCIYTMSDTNFIPLSSDIWWLPLFITLLCAVTLFVIAKYCLPKEEQQIKEKNK